MNNYSTKNSTDFPFFQEKVNNKIHYDVDDVKQKNKYVFNFFKKYLYFLPDNYIKYAMMLILHLTSIMIFTLIYYLMMLDFNNYYFIPEGFAIEHFKNNLLLISFFMSIQFQTTTAYVDLKLKSIIARAFVNLQVILTFVITFIILLE